MEFLCDDNYIFLICINDLKNSFKFKIKDKNITVCKFKSILQEFSNENEFFSIDMDTLCTFFFNLDSQMNEIKMKSILEISQIYFESKFIIKFQQNKLNYENCLTEIDKPKLKKTISELLIDTIYKPSTISELKALSDWNRCKFSFHNIKLDDEKSLQSYNIKNNSIIVVDEVYEYKYYFIKTLTGRTIRVSKDDLDGDDLVIKVKQIIHEKEGIHIDQQRLICYSTQLMDDRSLNDYNIKPGAIFNLVVRFRNDDLNISRKSLVKLACICLNSKCELFNDVILLDKYDLRWIDLFDEGLRDVSCIKCLNSMNLSSIQFLNCSFIIIDSKVKVQKWTNSENFNLNITKNLIPSKIFIQYKSIIQSDFCILCIKNLNHDDVYVEEECGHKAHSRCKEDFRIISDKCILC